MTLPPAWRVPLLALVVVATMVGWAWPPDLPPWRTAGVVSGWAGAAFVATSVLLVLREARVARQLGGIERMLRGHHVTGIVGYLLLLLHPLALALDAGLQSPGDAWALLDPRGQGLAIGLGWLGLLLLMIGLGSTLVLRLPYRRWRAWHHLLGAGVVLGLVHVQQLLGDAAPIGWLAALTGLALLLRYGAVDRGWLALPYRVVQVRQAAAGVIEATLAPMASALHVQPGQFVLLALGDGPGFHGCGEFHPFTVSALEADGRLRLAIKALGPCSTRVQSLAVGTAVRLQGPFGDFLQGPASGAQLWVAGGIGITPFVAALRAAAPGQPVALVYLVRDPTQAAFADELQQAAAAHPQLQLQIVSSSDAAADLPALLDAVPDLAGRQVQACGPAPLLQALRQALAARGVPAGALRAERFDFR